MQNPAHKPEGKMIMPTDRKYGQVTLERQRHIADDEPVVVFAAHDLFTLSILRAYRDMCVLAGSPANHIGLIDEVMDDVQRWQQLHGSKVPTSSGYQPATADPVAINVEDGGVAGWDPGSA
jgi:hypothetical protein